MKIYIKAHILLPPSWYELTDRNKLERARAELGAGATDREIFFAYDRLGGRIVDENGKAFPPQYFWNLEKKRLNRPIEQFSDEELLYIIRRGENFPLTKDCYQRTNNEWQIRQQQKIFGTVQKNQSGVFFEVGGNMTNQGVIKTANNSVVDIAVAGNYSSDKNTKIIQGDFASMEKDWYEKPFGIILIAVITGLIVGGLLFWFGWN